MSKENLDQFMQKVTDSEELQARLGDEMDANALIALGAEHGCEFSADDLTAGADWMVWREGWQCSRQMAISASYASSIAAQMMPPVSASVAALPKGLSQGWVSDNGV